MKVSNERLADITEVIGAIVRAGDCRLYDAESKVPLMFKADTLLGILTEILSLRNAQSEAVAWRWRLTDSETWHTEKVDPSGRIGGAHIVVEPLYTHPAPQSEAVAVKALLHHVHKMLGYHIVSPTTPDHQFVNVCNGDLRVLAELFEAAALTHPAPPLAVTDEMVERVARALHDEWNGVGAWSSLTDRDRRRWEFMARASLTAALEAKQ